MAVSNRRRYEKNQVQFLTTIEIEGLFIK